MTSAYAVASVASAAAFLWYGAACLFADGMIDEFARYGLSRFRRLTGALELLGGAGLLVGLRLTPIMVVSASGLALLMLLGVITRVRVRDPWFETLPAAVLLVVNGALALAALQRLQTNG